jgi:hypothetical protein
MSSQELIKFLTREFVQYVDTPKEERLKRRQETRLQNVPWSEHWFGLLPFGIKMLLRGKNKELKQK